MPIYKRHDLLWLSDAGKEYAVSNIQSCIPNAAESEIKDFVFSAASIPAIVRRQDMATGGLISVGFSFPKIIDGVRLRIASAVPPDCIIGFKTPFDVAHDYKKKQPNVPHSPLVEELINAGFEYNVQVGFFGSIALGMVTDLPYWNNNSDMDLYLRCLGNWEELVLFHEQLLKLEESSAIVMDAEIEYKEEYGVKLKELFGPGKTALGKGLYEAVILPKDALIASQSNPIQYQGCLKAPF